MTEQHLRALGRVAVNFQALEMWITFWVIQLVGPDQKVGQMVTVQLPYGKLCVLASSLFNYRFVGTPFALEFEALIKQSLKLEEQRNQLFHSAWMTDDASGEISRLKRTLKLGKELAYNSPAMNPDEIDELADKMNQVATELCQLLNATGASTTTDTQ